MRLGALAMLSSETRFPDFERSPTKSAGRLDSIVLYLLPIPRNKFQERHIPFATGDYCTVASYVCVAVVVRGTNSSWTAAVWSGVYWLAPVR